MNTGLISVVNIGLEGEAWRCGEEIYKTDDSLVLYIKQAVSTKAALLLLDIPQKTSSSKIFRLLEEIQSIPNIDTIELLFGSSLNGYSYFGTLINTPFEKKDNEFWIEFEHSQNGWISESESKPEAEIATLYQRYAKAVNLTSETPRIHIKYSSNSTLNDLVKLFDMTLLISKNRYIAFQHNGN